MQLNQNQLAAQLAKGLAPLYVLHGDEPLLEQETLEVIRRTARQQGFGERTAFVGAATQFDWSAVLAAAASQSLFAERQIVEIRLPTGKPGKEGGQVLHKLAEQAAASSQGGQASDTLLIVLLPRADRTMQQSPWFAALEKAGAVVRIDPVPRRDMPAWLAQRLKAQDQGVPAGDEGMQVLAFFTDCVEGNLMAAHQEIQKLGLLYPPGELSRAQIEASVLNVARYSINDLSEAALSGQLLRSQKILDGLLAEGEAPVRLHSVLAGDVLSLYRARQALDEGTPMPQALRQARAWGPKEKLFERVLPRLRLPPISRVLQSAHTVDGICKGLKNPAWPTDAPGALQRLLMQLCRLTQPTAQARR
ncbi:DNA polymerase III subunit delta [Corticibacter populi]|uniref:DNA polymerase III subunit delta n=1 Tax=Corticibacter populi TaxID=1550736 RepID=A0A3M6QQF6_9BURK|nr:DNA polymerase III subunit delta [Corticibacter populi]RMX05031.1 DNA polymerase III subunit delta [Corticibacter populi]RZS33533.1 DNA polymerase III delta subunit [Corticibacter populi]